MREELPPYSNAALSDALHNVRADLQKERLKRKLVQDKLNEAIESLNAVAMYLDGQSVHKAKVMEEKTLIVNSTFIGRKIDYLESDFLEEG